MKTFTLADAPNPHHKGPAFKAAWRRGWLAGRTGQPRINPYPDKRSRTGCITFARAFNMRWEEGWEDGHQVKLRAEYLARHSRREGL